MYSQVAKALDHFHCCTSRVQVWRGVSAPPEIHSNLLCFLDVDADLVTSAPALQSLYPPPCHQTGWWKGFGELSKNLWSVYSLQQMSCMFMLFIMFNSKRHWFRNSEATAVQFSAETKFKNDSKSLTTITIWGWSFSPQCMSPRVKCKR